MKTLHQYKATYLFARSMLIPAAILTFLSSVMGFFGTADDALLTPLSACLLARFAARGLFGLPQAVSAAIGLLLPAGALMLIYFLSKKERYGWLIPACAFLFGDCIFTYFYITVANSSGREIPKALTVMIVGILLLFSLIVQGVKAGRRIGNGVFAPARELKANPEDIAKGKYAFDLEYALSHVTDIGRRARTHAAVVVTLLLLAPLRLPALLIKVLGDRSLLPPAISAAIFVLLFILTKTNRKRLYPYLLAETFVYFAGEDGALTREQKTVVNKQPAIIRTQLRELKILKTIKNGWKIAYTAENGKRRRDIIPNAYPGLEKYMEDVAK